MSAKDLETDYADIFATRVGFGEAPALLLVDFAKAYFDRNCALYADVDDALAAALRLRKAARDANIPVILTSVAYSRGGIDGGRFFEKAKPLEAFVGDRDTAELVDDLVPETDEILVAKQYPSAFFGTSLASTLTYLRRDSVILCGLTTSGCVRATCVDSMSHGFRTLVVREACGDRHPMPHEANLFDMNAKYADVVAEQDVLVYLEAIAAESKAN